MASRPSARRLLGWIDEAGPWRVAGWAADGTRPLRLEVLVDGVLAGVATTGLHRPDLEQAGLDDGRHGFELRLPAPLTGEHAIAVRRERDQRALPNAPVHYRPAAPALLGKLDDATHLRVRGWAHDPADADAVTLRVLVGGQPVARVVANAYRADLDRAGHGRGWRSFDLALPEPLPHWRRHVIEVRRDHDGAPLPGSGWVLEPAPVYDAALEDGVERALATLSTPGEQARALAFLARQADRLRARWSGAEAGQAARARHRQAARRLGPAAGPPPQKRALLIDETAPRPGRDAGSQALLSHAAALKRLGYAVSFAASEEMGADVPPFGFQRWAAPFHATVEDVLRGQAGCFDVVYLHRVASAARYIALVRATNPRARVLYSVADLHHLRLERQAAAEQRPELRALARRTRLLECTAAWMADAVVTHSLAEQALLRRAVPDADVHCVGWNVPLRDPAPFAGRQGLAFIGGAGHAPNLDAAEWLVRDVMPHVWAREPGLLLHLAGAGLPISLAGAQAVVHGFVPDLAALLDRVRLTVAPVRFGAGVKGKVLESLAAGVPCAMTTLASEGLPPGFANGVAADDPPGLAAIICRLHAGERAHAAAVTAGRNGMSAFTGQAVDAGLLAAIEGRRGAV